MRALLISLVLLLPATGLAREQNPRFPREYLHVLQVVVELSNVGANAGQERVQGATVSRDWLLSWDRNRSDRRDVTLQPVSPQGVPGRPTDYRGCTLSEFSGVEDESIVATIRINCQR